MADAADKKLGLSFVLITVILNSLVIVPPFESSAEIFKVLNPTDSLMGDPENSPLSASN